MEIVIKKYSETAEVEVNQDHSINLFADIKDAVILEPDMDLTVSTGIGVLLPDEFVGTITGASIKEFNIKGNGDKIKITYHSKTPKTIKPQELLGVCTIIPKQQETKVIIEEFEPKEN